MTFFLLSILESVSHALITDVRRLSLIPLTILASVLALRAIWNIK